MFRVTFSLKGLFFLGILVSVGVCLFAFRDAVSGSTPWTEQTGAGSHAWRDLAASSDLDTIVAVDTTGSVRISSDGGVTWDTQNPAGAAELISVTVTADGSKIAVADRGAGGAGGYVYVSTNGGTSWTEANTTGIQVWTAIDYAADGSTLAAVAATGGAASIWTSATDGTAWTEQVAAGTRAWTAISLSSDGSQMIASASGAENVYLSTDSGATWGATSAPSGDWASVASAPDGTVVVAVDFSGAVYKSTDSGSTWNALSGVPSSFDYSASRGIDVSDDGSKIIWTEYGPAAVYSLALSRDGGASWYVQDPVNVFSLTLFVGGVVSGDGNLFAAGNKDASIWTAVFDFAQPAFSSIAIAASTTHAIVSWDTDIATVHNKVIYSTDTSYSASTTRFLPALVATTTHLTKVGFPSNALACGTTYHFKLVAESYISVSPYGTSTDPSSWATSTDQTFTTAACTGTEWTKQLTSGPANKIAASADGTKLVTVGFGSNVRTSSDSGETWTDQLGVGALNWVGISSSADGMKLAAIDFGGDIYTSTDGGVSWIDRVGAGAQNWNSISSSADGMKLAATVLGGDIYTSTDGGATWTDRVTAGAQNWGGVTISSDGMKLAATINNTIDDLSFTNNVLTSTDGGATWTDHMSLSQQSWSKIVSSPDGLRLATIGTSETGIYAYSPDGGVTWTRSDLPDINAQRPDSTDIAISSDGMRVAVSTSQGPAEGDLAFIYTSEDGGTTWIEHSRTRALASTYSSLLEGYPSVRWYGISSSEDGTFLAAVDGDGGFVWTTDLGAPPVAPPVATSSTSTSSGGGGSSVSLAKDPDGDFVVVVPPQKKDSAHTVQLEFTYSLETEFIVISDEESFAHATSIPATSTAPWTVRGGGGRGTLYVKYCTKDLVCSDPVKQTFTLGTYETPQPNIPWQTYYPYVTQPGQAKRQKNVATSSLVSTSPSVPVVPPAVVPATPPAHPEVTSVIATPQKQGLFIGTMHAVLIQGFNPFLQHPLATGVATVSLAALLRLLQYVVTALGTLLRIRGMSDVPYLVRSAFHRLLVLLGVRQPRRIWGTVYDSDSKQPLDPALVELVHADTQEIVEQSFTDMEGKYGFLDRVGTFFIRARKTHYQFPSLRVVGTTDSIFDSVYHGEVFVADGVANALVPNIPMDALEMDWNQVEKRRMGIGGHHFGTERFILAVSEIIFWSGLLFMSIIFALDMNFVNGFFVSLYVVIGWITRHIPKPRLWGQITRVHSLVEGLFVTLNHPSLPEVVVGRAVTDVQGRFFLKAAPGPYTLHVRSSPDPAASELYTHEILVGKNRTVNDTIALP